LSSGKEVHIDMSEVRVYKRCEPEGS
jgi:hypothetical protein